MISLVQKLSQDGPTIRKSMDSRAAALCTSSRQRPRRISIAFVNSMCGAAFAAAERQYLTLLAAAGYGLDLEIRLYALLTDRGNTDGRDDRYLALADLWDSDPDALIVTGTEPRTADLAKESYWCDLKSLVDWARSNAISAIWSCLAAHAAVRCLDGILRRPLSRKCCGVYSCDFQGKHSLLNRLCSPVRVQHSRWNELDAAELRAAGYQILTQSAAAGVDMFIKRENALFVFFQGHPEYEGDTLLREYRRDVGRYLRYESDIYPAVPENCFDSDGIAALLAFEHRTRARRHATLLAELPLVKPCSFGDCCGASARRIYRNWLSLVSEKKSLRSSTPLVVPHAFARHPLE
jgi:homoserine O-succinyltransferase